MGILLVLCAVIFYLWRLFVFANTMNNNTKKRDCESGENPKNHGETDKKTVGKYSIRRNISE